MPAPELQEFFAEFQGGDDGAVEEMLYELDPFLRRLIRMRLTLADTRIAAASPTIATMSGGVASGGHQSTGHQDALRPRKGAARREINQMFRRFNIF